MSIGTQQVIFFSNIYCTFFFFFFLLYHICTHCIGFNCLWSSGGGRVACKKQTCCACSRQALARKAAQPQLGAYRVLEHVSKSSCARLLFKAKKNISQEKQIARGSEGRSTCPVPPQLSSHPRPPQVSHLHTKTHHIPLAFLQLSTSYFCVSPLKARHTVCLDSFGIRGQIRRAIVVEFGPVRKRFWLKEVLVN